MNFDKLVQAIDKTVELEYSKSRECNEENDLANSNYHEGRGDALAALRAAIVRGFYDN